MKSKCIVAAALFLLNSSASIASDWPNWRGQGATGASPDGPLPSQWSLDGENLVWQADFPCRSGPIVMDGRLYMINVAGEGRADTQERVVCLDAATGKLVWEHRFNVWHTDIVTNRVGWSNVSGDPETGYVYAHGVQGMFFCFDRDGKIVWKRSLTESLGRISGYGGRTNSPIIFEDLAIFSSLFASWGSFGAGRHRFLAFDKRTGEVVWWSDFAGRPLDTTYSVPVVTHVDGMAMLVAGNADGAIYGLKPRTGEMLWKFRIAKRGLNSSPVVDGDRVYVSHSEENIDSTKMGRLLGIDATGRGDVTKTHEIWRINGLAAGYASPVLQDGRLYVSANSANLHCVNAADGAILWTHNYGTIAKGSPVWGDGKLYVGEVSSKIHIIEDRGDDAATLDTDEFHSDKTRIVEIFGSPAIANGRVYFSTDQATYCIGLPGSKSKSASERPVANAKEISEESATHIHLAPADVTMFPGDTVYFQLHGFDAQGRPVEMKLDDPPAWSLPTPPPPPSRGPMAGAARGVPLQGELTSDGYFTADANLNWQAGVVAIKHSRLSATARVRVVPRTPYVIDFEDLPENGGIPGVINIQASKARVTTIDGQKVLRKLASSPSPPFARMRGFLTPPITAGYTVSAELTGTKKRRFWPDMGLINCRYLLILRGNTSPPKVQLTTWEVISAKDRNSPGGRVAEWTDFDWKPGVWYRAKLSVDIVGTEGVVRGKVWPRDQEEPADWTVELRDPWPNSEGSPGLYGYARGVSEKSKGTEVLFDNVHVERNSP